MKKKYFSSKKGIFIGGIISIIIGFASFFPLIVNFNGQYLDRGDYLAQYVPFIKELKRMLFTGDFSWSWNSFLGDDFISAYSYYTVFNPFAWFVTIFPNDLILYGTLIATLLKFFISTIFSAMYLKRFTKRESLAVIGALLYTFSGFTIVNTNFYFFLDAIAVFPLLMYGLERLICDRKRKIYIIALLINASINYYFFVSTVFLIIFYVFFRLRLYSKESWLSHKRTFADILISSIIGTGIAGVSIVPSLLSILNSAKATENIGSGFKFYYWSQRILENIKILLSPIESNRFRAFYDSSVTSSNGVYLPIFGCVFVFQYIWTKKDWIKKLCVFLLICLFVPCLNSLFCLYSSYVYTRWLYGMALIFSLATILALEDLIERSDVKTKIINRKIFWITTIFVSLILAMPTIVYFLYKNGINILNRFASVCIADTFMGYTAIIIMICLTVFNYVCLWYIGFKKISVKKIFIIVCVGCIANFSVYNILNYDDYDSNIYYENAIKGTTEKTDNDFIYRVDYSKSILNYGLYKNMPAVNYYNSIQNSKSSEFVRNVGMCGKDSDTAISVSASNDEYLDALLSVKFYYDYSKNNNIPEGFVYFGTENGVDIYENENYLPMGFTYEYYCLKDKISELDGDTVSKIMLNALIINSEDEILVSKYLKNKSNINTLNSLNDSVSKLKKEHCYYFKGDSRGFDAEIDLSCDNIVFFSIPNDKNWTITVNGEDATIIDVNCGLIGVCCNTGKNIISATYHIRGLGVGIICTSICLLLWMIYEIVDRILFGRRKNVIDNYSCL